MATRWIELSCQVSREAADAVAEVLSRHAPGGVAIHDEPPVALWEGEEPSAFSGTVRVAAYLPDTPKGRAAQAKIERGLWLLGLLSPLEPPTVRVLSESDWLAAWKEHFQVLHVGQRLVIRPTWRAYEPRLDEVVVTLDPGLAFGTGLHPSTQLCLAELEHRLRPGMAVLDLGTGSGILAIAAARLGAERVLALDVDPQAVATARGNVALNNVADRVTVSRGTLPVPERFDLVVANIVARVIADLAAELARALRPGGTLVASGIVAERESEVLSALAGARLMVVARVEQPPWVALVAEQREHS